MGEERFVLGRQRNSNNQTAISDVVLLGFEIFPNIRVFVFVLLLLIYGLTVCGNLLIIILVAYSKTLHSPMYFFLSQLSTSDIMLATNIVPSTLHGVLHKRGRITFGECIVQLTFFVFSGSTECVILAVMSYDRYMAICKPLHYTSVMNPTFCVNISGLSWLFSILIMVICANTVTKLDFCGPNVVDHFFCDPTALAKIACSDTTIIDLPIMYLSVPVLYMPFLSIIISYSYVVSTVLKIPTRSGKEKAFSTCSSHLTVVFIFYITLICMYSVPFSGASININKVMSLMYTAGTPLINPVIYSLRNKDIKVAVEKVTKFCTC
ncbi:olfactory receptor 2G3-like [Hyperolius riggenbachi]|uniref:olfactory receptor 2G3-like n=1 Tax=Hyperolius riggenbachi TaxID=752182 RepID=UPI0035A2EF59